MCIKLKHRSTIALLFTPVCTRHKPETQNIDQSLCLKNIMISLSLLVELLSKPPGFAKGMEFAQDKKLESFFKDDSGDGLLRLTDVLAQGDEIDFGGESDGEETEPEVKTAEKDDEVCLCFSVYVQFCLYQRL